MQLPGWKQLLARTLLMAAGLAIGLVCAEILLRWTGYDHPHWQFLSGKNFPTAGFPSPMHYTYDPLTGYSMVTNINDDDRGITTDRNGFRVTARAYDSARPSIIFVGDSTVFGYLSRDEDSYPYIISQMPEFNDYNIVNMGVPGYSLAHITQVMKHKVPQFSPKLVVVEILWPWKPFEGYRSSPNAWKQLDMAYYGKSFTRRPTYEKPKDSRFATAILLEDMWLKIRFDKQVEQNFARPTEIYDFQVPEDVERQLAGEHVKAFHEASKPFHDAGVKVMFYIHPFQYTLFRDEYKGLGSIGRQIMIDELGAVYMGDCILDHFSRRPTETLFVDSEHMTKAGNIVLAGCVADGVKRYIAH